MRVILALILLMISTSAFSFSLSDYNGRCGNAQVVLGPTYGKYATANSETNTITIDPLTPRIFSPRGVEFIFFHECGHITYQHRAAHAASTQFEEDQADCYAAKEFTNHYGREQLQQTMWEMRHINGIARNYHILNCR